MLLLWSVQCNKHVMLSFFQVVDHEGAADPPVPSKEDIPTFDEWKKKVMEVEEKKSKRWLWVTELRVHQWIIACQAAHVLLLHQCTLTRTSFRTHFCSISQSCPFLRISFYHNFCFPPLLFHACNKFIFFLLTFVGSVVSTLTVA